MSKLECSKQAYALNTLAWDNTIGLWPILLVCRTRVMIERDSRRSRIVAMSCCEPRSYTRLCLPKTAWPPTSLSKLECSKQAYALNTLAWNNTIGLWPILLVCRTGVMIERDSRGHSYFIVRGEILGFMKDELLRKHLPRMFSLIKNESWGIEDD